MASVAKACASATAAAKAQTMARKAGHAWNEHDARCIGDALDAAIARRRNVKDVKVEYGAVRFRFDLKDDGEVEVNEEKGGDVEHSGGLPAGDGQASQSAPARPPGLEPSQAPPKKPINPDPSYDDLRKRAEKAAAKRRRQKAARKGRDEAKREQASKYVSLPYGSIGAATTVVDCPLWSARVDLKAAFIKLLAEVTERMALAARAQGAPQSTGVSARFGGIAFQVNVLDGTFATFVTADELAEDLLVLLADGLNEERLASLLKRWSKAWRKASKGIREMDSLD